jgi:pimeloyl-ACP methyl ester carboxylesterase
MTTDEGDPGQAPIAYDEFSMFHENAQEFGLSYESSPLVRRVSTELGDGRQLSSLVWGEEPPELVFLHGGAQNAHTWDTVALALGRPLLCIDLPSHGHSDAAREGATNVVVNSADIATVVRALAPEALAIVGMSLGGMTTLALAGEAPELVRAAVLVDVTPGVDSDKSRAISAFIAGPESFDSFDALLERTILHNPTRSETSLRRGILHNAKQQADGSWVWRYRRFAHADQQGGFPKFSPLWDVVSSTDAPLLLVRGMRPGSVVDDADEAELLRRCPSARVERVEDAGHSVQGDTPLELARLIEGFLYSG